MHRKVVCVSYEVNSTFHCPLTPRYVPTPVKTNRHHAPMFVIALFVLMTCGSVSPPELPQRGPVISGDFQDSMDEGERVRVNCTAYRSRPAANLTWYINGARVSYHLVHQRGQGV